jgi:hypothetical protein
MCAKPARTLRIDLDGFSGEPFLVLNRRNRHWPDIGGLARLGRRTWQVPLISRSIDNAHFDEGKCVQNRLHASRRLRGQSFPSFQPLKSSPARHAPGLAAVSTTGKGEVNHAR